MLTLAGVGLVAMATGRVPSNIEAPPLVKAALIALGVLVGLFGVMSVHVGMSGLAFRLSARGATEREPWRGDHPWTGTTLRDEASSDIVRSGAMVLAFGSFLFPCFLIAFQSLKGGGETIILVVILAFFALAWTIIAASVAWRALVRMRHGRKTLRLSRFPCFAGEPVIASLRRGESLREARRIEATLRCVQEQVVPSGRHWHQKRFETWSSELVLEGDVLRAYAEEIPLSFETPSVADGTDLALHPPRYWEIEIRADVPGIDWRARFLVPLYRRA